MGYTQIKSKECHLLGSDGLMKDENTVSCTGDQSLPTSTCDLTLLRVLLMERFNIALGCSSHWFHANFSPGYLYRAWCNEAPGFCLSDTCRRTQNLHLNSCVVSKSRCVVVVLLLFIPYHLCTCDFEVSRESNLRACAFAKFFCAWKQVWILKYCPNANSCKHHHHVDF